MSRLTNKISPGMNSPDSGNRRIASPSPSSRNISSRRVIHERQPLLEDLRHPHTDPSLGSNLGGSSNNNHGFSHDDESIIYKNYNTHSSESSVLGFNSTSTNPSHEYTPTNTQTVEALEWSEILPYYLPCFSWIKSYNLSFFLGDLIGGLSLVFFQLPLSLSYATTLAHVPVISGLYSLGIAPLVYLIFGSVPQMIVGPEGPISLVVGQAVEPLLHHHEKLNPMEYVVAITFVSGASLLGFGLGRFGFLDNVLSAALLKGFISAIGIVMIINALVVVLGLQALQKQISDDPNQMDIHSPFDKLVFLTQHWRELNLLSFKISIVGFSIIMFFRIAKKVAGKRKGKWFERMVFIPEILIVVATLTWLCSIYRWDLKGIAIIGKVHSDGALFVMYNPFTPKMYKLMKSLGTSGFLAAMLGFFESTTASKSLGSTYDLPISSNRELVALGFINLIGSTFGALPAFGGYGRSKINAISAKTTMLGAIMGVVTLFTLFNLLDYLFYVPECMLSVITAVIGISLLEEAPYEIYFHWLSRGYNELVTFGVTVITTIFFSMEAGIAVGLVYSLIRVIKHSAESRIQILGRYPGSNTFFDADIPRFTERDMHRELRLHPAPLEVLPNISTVLVQPSEQDLIRLASCEKIQRSRSRVQLDFLSDDHQAQLNTVALEEIEGCLIVKIPEPLTFTNSSDLRARLLRVERYGSAKAHPALKRLRDISMTKFVIFDLHGMTELDSSAARILKDLLSGYEKRNIHTFFVRVHASLKLRNRLVNTGICDTLTSSLLHVKYFEAQRGLRIGGDDEDSIYDLIESNENPFFSHISDSLKVIDHYEVDKAHFLDEEVFYV